MSVTDTIPASTALDNRNQGTAATKSEVEERTDKEISAAMRTLISAALIIVVPPPIVACVAYYFFSQQMPHFFR